MALLMAIVAMVLSAAAAGPQKKLPSEPMDLNRATLQQLEQLPNVGPTIAHEIILFREESGPFQRVEDLLALRGISEKRFEKIRPYVYVGSKKKPPSSPAKTHGQSKSKTSQNRVVSRFGGIPIFSSGDFFLAGFLFNPGLGFPNWRQI